MKYIPVYGDKPSTRWHNCKRVLPRCEDGHVTFLTAFMGESGHMSVMAFDGKSWAIEESMLPPPTHWRELPPWPKTTKKKRKMVTTQTSGM